MADMLIPLCTLVLIIADTFEIFTKNSGVYLFPCLSKSSGLGIASYQHLVYLHNAKSLDSPPYKLSKISCSHVRDLYKQKKNPDHNFVVGIVQKWYIMR